MNYKKFRKRAGVSMLVIIIVYFMLMIPLPESSAPAAASKAFAWNRDAVFISLEKRYAAIKAEGMVDSGSFQKLLLQGDSLLNVLQTGKLMPADLAFQNWLDYYLSIAPFVAVDSSRVQWYFEHRLKMRSILAEQSVGWNANDPQSRITQYKLVYGSRAALEEVFLQQNEHFTFPFPVSIDSTGNSELFGVEVKDGDILLSRGGAPVSAFISRANDFPGNFSHVALLHIDSGTGKKELIEAHIEKGVALSDAATYIRDKKLRFLVLRLKNDSNRSASKAASSSTRFILEQVLKNHFPYDFAMDETDHKKMFCSEVVSAAYETAGIHLWDIRSGVTSKGARNWLYNVGVRDFESEMPSDLEYDHQLEYVGEWWDRNALIKDHIDNAAMDVLFERADAGAKLNYNRLKLPMARVMKFYGMIQNLFGKPSMIPEGMNAETALRNQELENLHNQLTEYITKQALTFQKQKGYFPPYWQLLKIGRSF